MVILVPLLTTLTLKEIEVLMLERWGRFSIIMEEMEVL
jgi:hypothetical protein